MRLCQYEPAAESNLGGQTDGRAAKFAGPNHGSAGPKHPLTTMFPPPGLAVQLAPLANSEHKFPLLDKFNEDPHIFWGFINK